VSLIIQPLLGHEDRGTLADLNEAAAAALVRIIRFFRIRSRCVCVEAIGKR